MAGNPTTPPPAEGGVPSPATSDPALVPERNGGLAATASELVGAFLIGCAFLTEAYYEWWSEQLFSTGHYGAVGRVYATSTLVASVLLAAGVLLLGGGWAAARVRRARLDPNRAAPYTRVVGFTALGIVGVLLIAISQSVSAAIAAAQLRAASVALPTYTPELLLALLGVGVVLWGLGAFGLRER